MNRYISFYGFSLLLIAEIDIIKGLENYFGSFFCLSKDYNRSPNYVLETFYKNYNFVDFSYNYKEENIWGTKFFLDNGFIICFKKWNVVLCFDTIINRIEIYSIEKQNVIKTCIRLIKQILLFNHERVSKYYSIIHASSFIYKGKIVIISSPCSKQVETSNYGKSMALLSCLFNLDGLSFFSDDNIILFDNLSILPYPDLIGIKQEYENLFPKIKNMGYIYGNRKYLSVSDLMALGVDVNYRTKRNILGIIFIDFREKTKICSVNVQKKEAADRLLKSVRYDFMFSSLYNPNWLELRRKTISEIEFCSKDLINTLLDNCSIYVSINGFGTPSDISSSIKNIID